MTDFQDKPIPGTYGALTRSTEEEHKAFMIMLKQLLMTPEELAAYLSFLASSTSQATTPQE